MKVTDVKTIKLSYTPSKVPIDGLAAIRTREAVLVQVFTDEGIVGTGESIASGDMDAVEAIIHQVLKHQVIGENPFFVEKVWENMYRVSFRYGRRGIAVIGMSGIDTALWDIVAQACDKPVYQVLGAHQNRIRAYASGGYFFEGAPIEELIEEMAGYVAEGYSAVKMKLGVASPAEDVKRVGAVRKAIGDEVDLMVDANNAWDTNTAVWVARRLEPYQPYFLEEPVSSDNIDGSARLADSTDIPIAGYETEYTRWGFRELITRGAVDIVQCDVTWSGGITECRKIAAMAGAFHLLCIPHCYGSAIALIAGMHFIAATSNAPLLEFGQDDNPLRDDLFETPIRVENGYVTVPDGPGWGLKLDMEKVRQYAVET